MESNYSKYVLVDSINRISEILQIPEANYQESEAIPSRDSLTFENGFYVSSSVVFIDMRRSKTLVDHYNKSILAKLYRSYISELVAVLKGDENIREISIEGDCVWGVFDTPFREGVNEVFSTAAKAASLIDILNFKFSQKGIPQISTGIGMSDGNILMIKAGYKNVGINDVAWIGGAIGEAARLCSYGNRTSNDKRMMVSNAFYNNLNEKSQAFFEYNSVRGCYHGSVINTAMNGWLESQKKLNR